MKFVTEIHALDPKDGHLKKWAGPEIDADSIDEAREYCDNNGLGYCDIIGEFVEEVDGWTDFEQTAELN